MLNELYTPIKGTPHIVKVVNVVREITKGEKIENTAITQQVLLQRQKRDDYEEEVYFKDDLDFQPFSMELELFLEEYEKFVEDESKKYYMLDVGVDPELFIRTNGTCEEDRLCGAEELKIIKHVLQDIEALQEEQANQIRKYNIGSSDYAKRKIQPWDIWLEYELNPWDADIVKRVLRNKQGQSRTEEYQKIIHICEERIRQIGACNG